jgi:uncharacterized protein YggE
MTRSNLAIMALAALVLAGGTRTGRAQFLGPGGSAVANLEGFTVAGKGAIGARPNRLEIDLEVSAASEMTSDVIIKYRDAKKRLQEAFATLKLGNVAVEERALAVDQKGQTFNPYFMDTPPARRGKVEVQLTRKLVVSCVNIREMDEEALLQLVAKLLDVAQDAGGKVGSQADFNPYSYRYGGSSSNGLVRFIVDDFEAIQEKAYKAAIDDARARAERLARLSGVELGPVAGVREVLVPGEKGGESALSVSFYGSPAATDDDHPRKRLESSRFQEIPVRVELQVRFTVAPPKVRPEGAR